MLNILNTKRWLFAGGLALVACVASTRNAEARRGIAATISNPNGCNAPSGVPWQAGVWGYGPGISGAVRCEIYAAGGTAWTPCSSSADHFDVTVTDVGGSSYSGTPYGHTVVLSEEIPWTNSVQRTGTYTSGSCGSVIGYGWATF